MKKLTQNEIAKKLHLTRSTYAQYEVERRVPEYATLEKLADFFDVSIDYLVGRELKEEKYVEETEAEAKRRKGKYLLEKIKDEKLDHTLFLLEQLNKE